MGKEIRLDIAGTTYREDFIYVKPVTRRRVMGDTPEVGKCYMGELTVTLTIPSSSIPRNAEIKPYIRDSNGTWKQKSVFNVFSRSVDRVTGYVTLNAYDAIFKAEQSFTQPGNQGQWPRDDKVVMQEIATRTNTTICSNSLALMDAINTATGSYYKVQYPGIKTSDGTLKPDGQGALTMRDVAGRIAGFYGGNWYIDDNGQWRLWQFGVVPADADYLVTEDPAIIVMGGVRILVK